MIQDITEIFGFDYAEIKENLQAGLQIFLIAMFVFGIIGIIWSIFKRSENDRHWPASSMIAAIITYSIMIIASIYFAFFFENPFFETF